MVLEEMLEPTEHMVWAVGYSTEARAERQKNREKNILFGHLNLSDHSPSGVIVQRGKLEVERLV